MIPSAHRPSSGSQWADEVRPLRASSWLEPAHPTAAPSKAFLHACTGGFPEDPRSGQHPVDRFPVPRLVRQQPPGQSFLGKLDPALFVPFLEGTVHKRLGLSDGSVLVGSASQPSNNFLHRSFHRPAVGEIVREPGTLAAFSVWLSSFLRHRKIPLSTWTIVPILSFRAATIRQRALWGVKESRGCRSWPGNHHPRPRNRTTDHKSTSMSDRKTTITSNNDNQVAIGQTIP